MNKVKIKKVFEENVFLLFLLKTYRYIRYYIFWQIKQNYWKSCFFMPPKIGGKLKKMKNSRNGRCFLIGTGPSLSIDDLEKLKNEDTIGVNSLLSIFEQCTMRPTFYGFLDPAVYTKFSNIIDDLPENYIFYSTYALSELGKRTFKGWKKQIPYFHNHLHHCLKYGYTNDIKFSKKPYKQVFDGYTVVYSMLQIAVFLGYKEIYLLGTDCNYDQKNQHFAQSQKNDVVEGKYKKLGGPSMIEAYKVAKKFADENNIKIFNATRGGMLEVFPRVDLDDVLKMREPNNE